MTSAKRIAVGPQQGRKAFMIRTIRPLDRPDPGLERAGAGWSGLVTPAKRGKGVKRIINTEAHSPAERHVAITWAQRLKRVFSVDIEVCGRCPGSPRVYGPERLHRQGDCADR